MTEDEKRLLKYQATESFKSVQYIPKNYLGYSVDAAAFQMGLKPTQEEKQEVEEHVRKAMMFR